MNNEPNIGLYDADSAEDFPVLKAFQQYIDAEQAKARKRLITISVLFAVVLIVVIAIFSMMVIKANERTQMTNDKMFELLMKDKDRSVEDAKAAAIQEATVKNLTDTLQKLQKQLEDQERKSAKDIAEARSKGLEESAAAVRKESTRQQEETNAKIQKAIALLKAEKAKLAQEKEKLRQEELERYRREHYPEYYAKKNAEGKKGSSIKVLTYADVEDDEEDEVEEKPVEPVISKPASATRKPAKTKPAEVDLYDEDAGIEYFNDDEDNFTIPVEVKGKRAGWRVPLD